MSVKKILLPAIALLAICLVATTLLALTNQVTKDRIDTIALESENAARAAVFPEASSFSDAKTVSAYTYYEALDGDGNAIGYTFTAATYPL